MNRIVWRRRVPGGVVALAVGVVAAAGLGGGYYLLAHANDPPPPAAPVPPADGGPPPPGTYSSLPLPVGTPVPAFEADGWVNGPPPQPGTPGPRLVVLDIWAHWCPACRETAPALVEAYRTFGGRGVVFVSLTNVDRDGVDVFAEQFGIPWPCGYGATLRYLSRLGAYRPDLPVYEVSPTLYLIGPDGKVLWHDDQARPRHLKDSKTLTRDLTAEIERILASDAGAK